MSLVRHGHIQPAHVPALQELYEVNPLLCDFVVKRLLRSREGGNAFPAAVFTRFAGMLEEAAGAVPPLPAAGTVAAAASASDGAVTASAAEGAGTPSVHVGGDAL